MTTHKRRLAIVDDDGTHIKAVYVESESIAFEGADLSGLAAPGIRNLRGISFRGAVLYWACLAGADLSGCNFEGADLRGATLEGASFVGANLRAAKLCRDNLGGTTNLRGADLTNADFLGADLTDAEYDERTKFPADFNPNKAGCLYVGAI